MKPNAELYDSDGYYESDGRASRLAPLLSGILYILDFSKAFFLAVKLKRLSPGISDPKTHSPLRVLDIGAGDGKFLYFMRRLGWMPFGTSASKRSTIAAKHVYGLNISHSTEIPEFAPDIKFSLITYWHVFEHLENPEEHAARLRNLLTNHGIVMIEVPNIESLGASIGFDPWLGSDLKHHINHMKRQELIDLLAANGLETFREETFSLKFSYPFLWSALLGGIFGKIYTFDNVFDVLKKPLHSLRSRPIRTLNAVAAVVYLAPMIFPLMIWGVIVRRGEIIRLYARHPVVLNREK